MTSPSGRIVYVNGEFLPEADARLSIFDRGFLFGDGIYEVTSVLEGKLIDSDLHMARLERSARTFSPGERVNMSFDPADCSVFPA